MIIQIKVELSCDCGEEVVFSLDYPMGTVAKGLTQDLIDWALYELKWNMTIEDRWICPKCDSHRIDNDSE